MEMYAIFLITFAENLAEVIA